MFRKIIKGLKDVWCGTLEFDTEPKKGSFNPVTSGGVYEAINGAGGAKEIVYFDIDPSDPPSGIYEDIGEALANNKEPVIKNDGAVYFYSSTGTDKYIFVGGYDTDVVNYTTVTVSDDDSVVKETVDTIEGMVFPLYYHSNDGGFTVADKTGHALTKTEIADAYRAGQIFMFSSYPASNTQAHWGYCCDINIESDNTGYAEFFILAAFGGDSYKWEKYRINLSSGTEFVTLWGPNTSYSTGYSGYYADGATTVSVSTSQNFNATQKAQGRSNIGAASASDVTALQSQVSSLSDVSAYSVKGESTVAQLNAGPSGIQAGWAYQLTDSGTLTEGSLAVVAGDTVAWDGTKWFPLVKSDYYATKTYAQNVAHSIAPEFDATRDEDHKYLVNEFVVNDGKLYRFDADHYGAWNASHAHRVKVEEFLQCFGENSVAVQDFYQSATKPYYIKLDYNVGDSVAFTYVSFGGYACLVLTCKKGDVFKINGRGGSASRLWGFVDSNDKLVSVADADKTEIGVEHIAPCDGKFVFNSSTSGITPYCKKVVSLQKIYSDYQTTTYKKDLFASNANTSHYIATNVGIGNTVNLTAAFNNSFSCLVVDCSEGDKFFIRGEGGSASRLWCFVDSSNKVVSVASEGAASGADGIAIIAPCTGKLIFNTLKAYSGGTPYCKVNSGIADYVESNFDKIYKSLEDLDGTLLFKDVDSSEVVNGYYIDTNISVGGVVNLTPVSNSTFCYVVRDCLKGDLFEIRGNGGSTPRLWCFVDSSNKVVSVANENASTGTSFLRLEAPCDGKIIYNSGRTYAHNFRVLYDSQDYIDEQFAVSNNRLDVLEKYDIPNDPTPFSQLGTLLADLDLSQSTRMEQIYDLFDDLVTDYPSLITKYDAAELVDLSYPRYANGVSAGDPDYRETPAYKTHIYKISNVNEAAGNLSAFPKKKLLIVGAVHGNEYYASVNCYSLAAHLLKNISSDLFSILALFDIWIMPCTNGYGIIHQQRPNANNVDINRNFGTSKWAESGSVDLGTWSGSTPDSEFEVQLIEGLKEYIDPDFFVDHHCSPSHSNAQFYSESPSEKVLARSYNSLVQISDFLVKNFPTYFGAAYHLFRDQVYSSSLPYEISKQQGHADLWMYEHGIESVIIEIFGYINYTDGEYDSSGHTGTDLWMVSEFTLRNQLAKYLPIVLT